MLEESTGNFSSTRNMYDWYQTNSHVIINVGVKNLKEADVKVKLIDETLDVTCNLADGNIFKLHFNLFKPIYVQDSNWTVTPSKLEIKLKKTDRKRWQSLEHIPEKSSKKLCHQKLENSHTGSALNNSTNSGSGLVSITSTASKSLSDGNDELSKSGISNATIHKAQLLTLNSNRSRSPHKPKHDWYQNENQVIVVVHIRNLTSGDVRVHFEETRLNAVCKCEDGSIYNIDVNLHSQIIAKESEYSITPSKLEIKMRKATKGRWSNLESSPEIIKNETCSRNETCSTTTIDPDVDDEECIENESSQKGQNIPSHIPEESSNDENIDNTAIISTTLIIEPSTTIIETVNDSESVDNKTIETIIESSLETTIESTPLESIETVNVDNTIPDEEINSHCSDQNSV